jgi:hypothetical protein
MNLKFKSTKEHLPKDGEEILYIKMRHTMGGVSAEPRYTVAEWQWWNEDLDGLSHDPEYSLDNRPKDYPYLCILDGHDVIYDDLPSPKRGPEKKNHFWWMTEEEFWGEIESSEH